ncbi:MAG: HEAT repeat domain-containing protein [Phycisphaeraceae bacterium]|nr:HEAT repeat domain-containing protein [Phycisphaeraceae bacterium]
MNRPGRWIAAGLSACAGVLGTGCGLEFREGAATLTQALAPPTPTEAAERALSSNPDLRAQGTLLLANAPFGGGDPYVMMYEDYINDPAPTVRAAATRALGNHGVPRHAPMIAANLRDPQRIVRIEAARALQRVHNPAVIESLLWSLQRGNEQEVDVRAEVAHALGQYPDHRVLQQLISALGERQLRVTHSALASLRTLTGQDFGLDRRAWLEWIGSVPDPFAARSAYVYPVFHRDKLWFEFLPFMPPPPNEQSSNPSGMARDLSGG